jgi:CheY-like chemotaxis protein
VRVDRDQIDQVLLNLSTNARDAMPHGGTVLVRVTCDQLGAAGEIPAAQPGQYAHLSFSDTGTGMDAGTLARLFEPFFTTKEIGKGTGLGLPVVWGIVAQHRGFITVKSEVGKGTTFDVFFPIVPAEPDDPGIIQGTLLERRNATVFIAAHDPDLREQVRRALYERGYAFVEAANGVDAVERFQKLSGDVDLVLLDIALPRLNGWEVALEMRKCKPGTRIVFLGDFAPDRFGHESPHVDDSRLLLKPFTASQLTAKVQAALDE